MFIHAGGISKPSHASPMPVVDSKGHALTTKEVFEKWDAAAAEQKAQKPQKENLGTRLLSAFCMRP